MAKENGRNNVIQLGIGQDFDQSNETEDVVLPEQAKPSKTKEERVAKLVFDRG